MPVGELTLNLRPIKLAFLVELSDIAALHTAIEINSFLWGGAYNPIIPVFHRKPKNWERFPSSQSPIEIVLGYLDAYDPDFVVPLGKCADREWNLAPRSLLHLEDILPNADQNLPPSHGIGLFETLNHL